MPKDIKTLTRGDWIKGALRRLAAKGVDKVAVAPLARELGVTKGSFYWHFKDRQALLDAMLKYWEDLGTSRIIAQVETHGGTASQRLAMVVQLSIKHVGGSLEPALRDWGRRDNAAWQVMRRVDNRRMGYLRRQFLELCGDPVEAEARSWLFYSLLGGIHLLAASPTKIARNTLLARCAEVLTRGPTSRIPNGGARSCIAKHVGSS